MPNSKSVLIVATWLVASACVGEDSSSNPSAAAAAPGPQAMKDAKCIVLLHGKGGGAQADTVAGDIRNLRPGGNGAGWGGREWRYFPEDRYQEVRTAVADALQGGGCGRAVIQGFSNGAAAAAKLYCRGEDFNGTVLGYLLDDPVPDQGVVGCRPRAGVRVRLYSTGALSVATDGWSCATQDWTCEGGRTIGIERYARELGTGIAPSIHTTHTEYLMPPEVADWLQ